jgi:hypothetical protein
MLKNILKAKEELRKLKYFTMQKIYNLQTNLLKEIKIFQNILFIFIISLVLSACDGVWSSFSFIRLVIRPHSSFHPSQ